MFDPFEVNRISNIYYEERVLDAKSGRKARKNGKNEIGMVQRAGDFLIAAGQKLKGHPQSAPIPLTVTEE
jgi:hypothetical protein